MHRACQLSKQVRPGRDVNVFADRSETGSSLGVSTAFGGVDMNDGEARTHDGDAN